MEKREKTEGKKGRGDENKKKDKRRVGKETWRKGWNKQDNQVG